MGTVAAFDFDGTITRRDSLLPFLRFISGNRRFAYGMLRSSAALGGLGLKLVSSQAAKEHVLHQFVRGETASHLHQMGVQYCDELLCRDVRRSAIQCLRGHLSEGHRCILVSASLDCYLGYWGQSVGFDDVLCTRLEYDELGRATGRISGKNCKGGEKVSRLKDLLGNEWPPGRLVAYGDSSGDRELLAAADHAYFRHFRG